MKRLPSKAFAINAPWTAVTPVQGWRHYRVATTKPAKTSETGLAMVELMAVCDRSVRFWITRQALAADPNWITGWKD